MLRLEDLHVLISFQELAEARLHQSRVMCSCRASLTHLVRDEAWLAAWFPVSVTSVDGSFFLVENAHKSLDYVCQKKEYILCKFSLSQFRCAEPQAATSSIHMPFPQRPYSVGPLSFCIKPQKWPTWIAPLSSVIKGKFRTKLLLLPSSFPSLAPESRLPSARRGRGGGEGGGDEIGTRIGCVNPWQLHSCSTLPY